MTVSYLGSCVHELMINFERNNGCLYKIISVEFREISDRQDCKGSDGHVGSGKRLLEMNESI